MAIADYVTRILTSIGGVHPYDYAGGFVYLRRDNDHSPESPIAEIEWIDPPEGNGPRQSWDCPTCEGCGSGSCESPLYDYPTPEHAAIRCDCETCDGRGEWQCTTCRGTGEDRALRWTLYRVPVESCDWIDWHAVAACTGADSMTYLDAFEQGDRLAMARAIEDYATGYGSWYQLDQYPLSLTRAEVTAWAASLRAIEVQGPRFAIDETPVDLRGRG